MSATLCGQVWELDLPHNLKLVALALADHGHDDGSHIFPSQKRLGAKCGITDRQVRTNLRKLEEIGLLERVAEPTRYETIHYHMHVAAVPRNAYFDDQTGSSRHEDQSDRKFATSRPEVCDIQTGSSRHQTGSSRHSDRKSTSDKPSYNHQLTTKEPSRMAGSFPQLVETLTANPTYRVTSSDLCGLTRTQVRQIRELKAGVSNG